MKIKMLIGLLVFALLVFLLPQMLQAKAMTKGQTCGTTSATDLKSSPDLIVATMEVKTVETGKNGKIIILYTVKNQGKFPAKATLTRMSIDDQAKGVVVSQPTPDLQPGGSYTGKVEYTAAEGKKYVFKATADYKNNAFENNERNNDNSMYFSFGRILIK